MTSIEEGRKTPSKLTMGATLAGLIVGSAGSAWSSDETGSEMVLAEISPAIEMIVVTGSSKAVKDLGGSVQFISEDVLTEMKYSDVNRMLRLVPGINIQEEDGFGLRPNIGLRGTGLDRSSKIAIHEDGVLAAPAPYAAPSAYYFPSAGRMNAVEVVKGPAGIKYGPLTTGGAINFFSTPIPSGEAYEMEVAGGSDGYARVHSTLGRTFEREAGPTLGVLGEVFKVKSDGFKVLDGGGNTGFDIADFVGKVSLASGPDADFKQSIEFKVQYSDEISSETYLGLTDIDFAANPYRRYRGSQLDQMDSEHKTFQASYQAELTDFITFSVVAYSTAFQRNWFKLDKVMGASISNILENPTAYAAEFEAIVGAGGYVSVDDALSIKNNNRSYAAEGLQALIAYDFETGAAAHNLEASIRFHKDEMDRFQWVDQFRMDVGSLVLTTAGVPGTDSNRIETAEAWSLFVLDQIFWGPVTLTPGVRVEAIELRREDFGKSDPSRTGVSLGIRENEVDVVIPGIGATYDLTDEISLLAGVHKGFTHPGAGSLADAEESVNFEFGARYFAPDFGFEVIAFFNDYSNLVGTCTASTGGGCAIGDQFDGGAVDVTGIEFMGLSDLGAMAGLGVSIPLRVTYTYTQAEFQTDFVSAYSPWGSVASGDEMPLIPEHQLNIALGVEGDRWSINANVNYTAEARASAGQGTIEANDRIDGRVVVDLEADYQVNETYELFATLENVFDETYLVSRTPAGLRPGKPQSFQIGFTARF
jgi:Fe(3+) dicitrate transport protein